METIDCPKCEHEHQPTGSHEDDSGEMECEACSFKFEVEVEYAPVFSTSCVEHEYGPFEQKADRRGELVECRFCVHCQRCQLREGVVSNDKVDRRRDEGKSMEHTADIKPPEDSPSGRTACWAAFPVRLREQGSSLYPGRKVHRLTVIGHQWRDGKYWRCVCECECGNVVCVLTHCVGKSTLSCGCLLKEIASGTGIKPVTHAGRTYDEARRRRTRSEIECLTCRKLFYPPDSKTKRCSKECRFKSGNYNRGGRPHQCEQCGEPFIDSRADAKFCTVECRNINQSTAERRELMCQRCDKQFVSTQDHGRWPQFCSRECFCATQNPATSRDCECCGRSFVAKYRKRRDEYERFCSAACSAKASRTGAFARCAICGKEVWTERLKLDRNANRYCSVECRNKISTDLSGGSWSGGVVRHESPNGVAYDMTAIGRRNTERPGHKTILTYKARYRLVVEDYIGRKLTRDEPVWHINRNMTDDRIENLYVFESMAEMWRAIANQEFQETSNLDVLRLQHGREQDDLGSNASDEDRARLLRKTVSELAMGG